MFLNSIFFLLAAVTRAAPIAHAGVQLTGETFEGLTSSGDWFIEFYSPYCAHCKHFAPIWQTFVQTYQEEWEAQGDFHFAQVDCVANGDLCAKEKITGYPTLWYYSKGKRDQEFKGNRDADSIKVWLEAKMPERDEGEGRVIDPVVPIARPEDAITKKENLQNAVMANQDSADDVKLKTQLNTRKVTPNENGQVVKLNARELEELINPENDNGPAFVKFFAPWCSHCKALAPTWIDLARTTKSKIHIIEVDCEDSASKDACKKYKVQGYPTLLFFSEGENTEYSGSRTLSQMESFALKAAAAQGVRDVSPYELTQLSQSEDVFFLFLYPQETPEEEVVVIHQASRGLLGAAHVYKSSSADLFHRYSLSLSFPHLITFKGHNLDIPYATLKLDIPKPRSFLASYLNALRLPSLGQLTVETSKSYLENVGHPLVALLPLSQKKHGILQSHLITYRAIVDDWIASTQKRKVIQKEVVFAWIDADEWASWLKDMYSYRVTADPVLLIAYPNNKEFWDEDRDHLPILLDETNIFQALEDISKGHIAAKSSRNVFEKFANHLESYSGGIIRFITGRPILTTFIVLTVIGTVLFLIWKGLQEDSRGYSHVSMNGSAKRD